MRKGDVDAAWAAGMEKDLMAEVQDGAGVWEQLVSEELGAWTDTSTYKMAEDLCMLQEYEWHFRRLSDIVHGAWRALERYHLRRCQNPLHQNHYVPWIGATHDAGLSIVHFGVMMTLRCLEALLKFMGPAADTTWPQRLSRLKAEWIKIAKPDLDKIAPNCNDPDGRGQT